ncbi:g6501 [Coccomyxa elongata]
MKSLETNKHLPNAKFMQLATVRPDGRPSVRTVVFRGFHNESDQVTFTTDTRTYKVEDIRQHPWTEICWYFPETREQFRLGGNLEVVGEDHPDKSLLQARQEAWDGMSRNGRAWFAWPPSGRARDPDPAQFEKPVPDRGETALPSFALAIMDVDTVDYIRLPDFRVGYSSSVDSGGSRSWSQEELNP